MNRFVKVGLVVAAALGLIVLLVVRNLGPPSLDDLDLQIAMQPVSVPDDAVCLNSETRGARAMELIHPLEGAVVIQGGDRQISDSAWDDFSPALPWLKNQNIQNLYADHCHYRSPGAPADCRAWECASYREVSGYTWRSD